MKVLLAPGGVGHEVPLQPQEDHGFLTDTEEDALLRRGGEAAQKFSCPLLTPFPPSHQPCDPLSAASAAPA